MWIANLSTGETAIEGEQQAEKPTPWQQLLSRCRETGISITGMKLRKGIITATALPKKSCDGYFQAYEKHIAAFSKTEVILQGIGSVVGDKVHIIWIDDSGNVSMDCRELSTCRIHTTLRD